MLDNLTARSPSSPLLNENVPLMTSEQPLTSQPNPMQSYLCNNVLNQSSESPTIVSLLQGSVQSDVNNLQPTQESLASSLTMTPPHQIKQNRTNQFFSQQTFVSKSFDESHYPQQQPMAQANSSVQVPLQTIPQGQTASSVIQNSGTNEAKNAKHPLFFSVSLGQLNQSVNPVGNFKIPVQVSSGNIFQAASSQQSPVVTNAEGPFRRHSYTTGQPLQSVPVASSDYMGTRRSRPIAPAAPNGTFAVPEVPVSLFSMTGFFF